MTNEGINYDYYEDGNNHKAWSYEYEYHCLTVMI